MALPDFAATYLSSYLSLPPIMASSDAASPPPAIFDK